MKLSLEIIKEYLEYPENPVFFKQLEDQLIFPRPVFYTNQKILQSHILYIAETTQIVSSIQCEKECALICIGKPSESISRKIDNLIVYDKNTDIFSLFNQIGKVFDKFDNWERSLLTPPDPIPSQNIYQQILGSSSEIFENGISLLNRNFSIIFEDEVNIKYGGYDEYRAERPFAAAPEIISYFKFDKEYQKITSTKEIFYYSGDVLPNRVLCKNLFQNDQFLVRVILTECIRPFRKTDEILLDFLCDHCSRFLQQTSVIGNIINEGLARLLIEAVETGKINQKAMESELRPLSWTNWDTYRIASIHASSDDLFLSTLNYFSYEIMNAFPGTYAFQYQDKILVLINETKAGSWENYSEELSVFVRENNFRVGISNFMDDIFNLQIMYHQAETALSIGLIEKPMEWIHWFSRYTLQYIYNKLTNDTELGQLYSPIYYTLERYDRENGSSYLETLRVYLECNMNAVQAAKSLFIQRSTMIYRLKRIREITDNDLTNRDDILHLNLTFSIIDREQKS